MEVVQHLRKGASRESVPHGSQKTAGQGRGSNNFCRLRPDTAITSGQGKGHYIKWDWEKKRGNRLTVEPAIPRTYKGGERASLCVVLQDHTLD